MGQNRHPVQKAGLGDGRGGRARVARRSVQGILRQVGVRARAERQPGQHPSDHAPIVCLQSHGLAPLLRQFPALRPRDRPPSVPLQDKHIMRLTAPICPVFGHAVSGRDLILIAGGMFPLMKATTEIHHRLERAEGKTEDAGKARRGRNRTPGTHPTIPEPPNPLAQARGLITTPPHISTQPILIPSNRRGECSERPSWKRWVERHAPEAADCELPGTSPHPQPSMPLFPGA